MRSALNILFLLAMLLLVGCEEEIELDIDYQLLDTYIVEATITNEFKAHEVYIHQGTHELNGESQAVSGAEVIIYCPLDTFSFTEDSEEPGKYLSDPFITATGVDYTLVFTHEGFTDSSTAMAIAVSALDDITIAKVDSLYRYYFAGSTTPCKMEVQYNWQLDEVFTTYYGAARAKEYFYELNNIDVPTIFEPTKQYIKFPVGTTVIRRKYSLSENHQEYLRHLLLETEWRGGIFDVEPGNIPSYFANGSLGFFAACMVVGDTLVVSE